MRFSTLTERLTEIVVIVSLMGAGLKIDRRIGWRRWNSSWRLIAITMPLSIAAVTLMGMHGLGLGLASALLLGGALAPPTRCWPPMSRWDRRDRARTARPASP